jgi:hypothetical protein
MTFLPLTVPGVLFLAAWVCGAIALPQVDAAEAVNAEKSGTMRPTTRAFLLMPAHESGALPKLLSQTGAFEDTGSLRPSRGLVPYDLNFPFWSDGASKSRWMALPNDEAAPQTTVAFRPEGEWTFPPGTVFVKHFEIALDEAHPEIRRRLETRLLVCDAGGGVYGATYKWRTDNRDADLLLSNVTEKLEIRTATGVRTQSWYYPSRVDCRTCHTEKAGLVLGVKTRQMNRLVPLEAVEFELGQLSHTSRGRGEDTAPYLDRISRSRPLTNQLLAWSKLGLFDREIQAEDLPKFAALATPDDPSRNVEDRARSYLDANCAHCHRPGGTVAYFDARYDTPLSRQNLIEGPVLIDEGIDKARVIAPNDPWRSIALLRASTLEANKMPPLAHEVLDERGIGLLREWIGALPGPKVLAPPTVSPPAGKYAGTVRVALSHPDPEAAIHFTLDGSLPDASDPIYTGPIEIKEATTVRAKAFKHGSTRSITAQATFTTSE